MMNNLEMTLPSGKPPPKTGKKPKINRIVVDAKGQTYLNDAPVTIPALKADLQQLKAADPGVSVVVKGADDVDYQNMINVLDVLQQLDITKVGLATETAASQP
jgi:biopolymer transport protein ExbD